MAVTVKELIGLGDFSEFLDISNSCWWKRMIEGSHLRAEALSSSRPCTSPTRLSVLTASNLSEWTQFEWRRHARLNY